MYLAGTVAVPQTFPEVGRLSIEPKPPEPRPGEVNVGRDLLVVEHEISPKLVISRTFFLSDVAAVFLPHDARRVNLDDGTWLVGGDVAAFWHAVKNNSPAGRLGIAYVREQAATLMQVEVGMTAAESMEYYPPLPNDRSVDHYRFNPLADAGQGTLCGTARDPGYCTDRDHRSVRHTMAAPRGRDADHIACT
jgi:hypothetical protein